MPQHTLDEPTPTISPLRQLRLASGLSASDFARLLAVDLAALYSIETGSRRPGGRFRTALLKINIDPEPLLHAHREWCAAQSERLSAAVGDQVRRAAETL